MNHITINHVGLAVPNIAEFLQQNDFLYRDFSRGSLITNPVQRVNEMFITDGATVLELLEPAGDDSPINGFLKRNRFGGLIHIAFDVDHLEDSLEEIDKRGGKTVVPPVPDPAFQNRRIAFAVVNGHLIELIERTHAGVV